MLGTWELNLQYFDNLQYTAQTGLPIFDRAALITNGNWWYASALWLKCTIFRTLLHITAYRTGLMKIIRNHNI